ncbi:MAG: hypothetical protein ACFFAN_08895 [Promethearchaeota archaeon]
MLLSDDQKKLKNEDNFLIIWITRQPNSVCEVANDLKYEKKKKDYYNRERISWFRISSHTFRLRDYHHMILRKK